MKEDAIEPMFDIPSSEPMPDATLRPERGTRCAAWYLWVDDFASYPIAGSTYRRTARTWVNCPARARRVRLDRPVCGVHFRARHVAWERP